MSSYEQNILKYRASLPVYQKTHNIQRPQYDIDRESIIHEQSNQPLNSTDKKSKQKSESIKCRSASKISDALYFNGNWPHLKVAQSIYQDQAVVDWIKNQLAKITDRLNKNQSHIEQLNSDLNQLQQKYIPATTLPNPHFQQLNKILSLVQKTQNRDDYRKTLKMIEQLRNCILQCHLQIKNIKNQKQQSRKQKKKNSLKLQNFPEEWKELNTRINKQSREFSAKIQLIQNKFQKWEEQYCANSNNIIIGKKLYSGRVITLLYEQKILSLNNHRRNDTAGRNKFAFKQRTEAEDPQKEDMVTVILTTKTYYLDNQGYLLDKSRHYLLDKNNQQIRLTNKEIQLLKQEDLL